MQKSKHIISLREHTSWKLDEIPVKERDKFLDVLQRFNTTHTTEFFKIEHKKIRTTQYVGFAKVGSYTIQVFPKILNNKDIEDTEFLTGMLMYTLQLKAKKYQFDKLDNIKGRWPEILINIFARETVDLLRKNFQKRYVDKKENSKYLKGKLLIGRHLKSNFPRATKFFCKFHVFSGSNKINQVLKFAAIKLLETNPSSDNKKILQEILGLLDNVPVRSFKAFEIESISFNRLNRDYEPLLQLTKLLLKGMNISLANGKTESFIFMFDMNTLFEEFIFAFIKKNKGQIRINKNKKIKAN